MMPDGGGGGGGVGSSNDFAGDGNGILDGLTKELRKSDGDVNSIHRAASTTTAPDTVATRLEEPGLETGVQAPVALALLASYLAPTVTQSAPVRVLASSVMSSCGGTGNSNGFEGGGGAGMGSSAIGLLGEGETGLPDKGNVCNQSSCGGGSIGILGFLGSVML
ncbi:putative lysozyme-like protein, partial [Schistocerca cancellata]|uniref:putative lysozyme-like protein n=1 Tax=Schistocerca cancellata TaxID=274614 RepID=UPI002119928D